MKQIKFLTLIVLALTLAACGPTQATPEVHPCSNRRRGRYHRRRRKTGTDPSTRNWP